MTSTPSPRSVLDTWMDGLNRGQAQAVLALYADNAVLIPTFAPAIHSDRGAIREYFDVLGSSEELSVDLSEESLEVQKLDGGIAVLGGIYHWRFRRSGKLYQVASRFTFVVQPGAEQPILHHHSSEMPRGL